MYLDSSAILSLAMSSEETDGSPAGLSTRSVSNIRMFSASDLIRANFVPYARSYWKKSDQTIDLWSESVLLRGSILASHPAAPGLIPGIPPKKFRGKIAYVAGFINGAGKRKVDRGLKMLIAPV